jgi:hypothetical protein
MKLQRRLSPAVAAAAALLVASAVSACGGSSNSSSTTGANANASTSAGGAASTSATGSSAGHSGAAHSSATDPTAPSAAVAASARRAAHGLAAGVVATVAGEPITLAAYQQAYKAQFHAFASGPVPLDPPGYTRCTAAMQQEFARLRQQLAKAKTRASHAQQLPTPSHATLVKDCQSRYQGIKTGVMTQLIQQRWIANEARAQGVTISDAQVNSALARQEKALGGSGGYGKYLARVGQTPQQAAGTVRLMLTEQALQQRRLGAPVAVTDQQVAAFFNAHHAEFVLPHQPNPKLSTYAPRIRLLLQEQARARRSAGSTTDYERHWRAQTVCAPGYVVPLCANA